MAQLNLLVLRCSDLPATARFYACLGLTFELHQHGHGPEHLAHERQGFVLELYPSSTSTPDQTGVGFVVDELEPVHARLSEADFAPGKIADQPWGRTFVVRDPDGRRVEVSLSSKQA